MKTQKRTFYPTKAAWAMAEANKIAKQIDDMPKATDFKSSRRKAQVIAMLRREEDKYRRIAARFAAAA